MGTEEASVTAYFSIVLFFAKLREGHAKQQKHKTKWNQRKPLFACSGPDGQREANHQTDDAESQAKQDTDDAEFMHRKTLFLGGGKRDRTADLLHAMQALSQLSYTPNEAAHYRGLVISCKAVAF